MTTSQQRSLRVRVAPKTRSNTTATVLGIPPPSTATEACSRFLRIGNRLSTVIVASSHDRWATHLAKAGLDHTVVAADLIEKIGLAVSHDGATLWADGERLEALDAPTIWRKPELANSVLDDRHRETLAILHHFAEVNPLSTDLPLQAPKLAHRRHPSLAPWQPAWWLLYNAPPEAWERLSSRSGRYVAKRLTPIRGAPPYTVEVDPARLSRSEPWWIEELIDSDSELTVAMLPRGIGEADHRS